MPQDITKKNIEFLQKLLQVMNDINSIDKELTQKYNINKYELELYKKILETNNNNFYAIVNNLQ